jgi:hypothetical protein
MVTLSNAQNPKLTYRHPIPQAAGQVGNLAPWQMEVGRSFGMKWLVTAPSDGTQDAGQAAAPLDSLLDWQRSEKAGES